MAPIAVGHLVSLDLIDLDPRDEPIEKEHLDALRSGLSSPYDFPPLVVVKKEDGRYLMQDGQHRYTILKEMGITKFPVIRDIAEEENRKSHDSLSSL